MSRHQVPFFPFSISNKRVQLVLLRRDFEPGEVIMEDDPLLVTREGEKVEAQLLLQSISLCQYLVEAIL